ncbi:MAG TPA: LmeA family phospholipid-binding protein [Chthonomonadaceae bacterium]|nr:LmeA family phospholipid-binding protein [Chthonomonadaceae bacterium]
MDDTLKVVTVSLFALLSLHFSLERRARDDATRQVNQAFHSTGSLHSTVESRGMLGMLANDVWSVDLYSDHQTSDQLPFYLYPRSGWKGHIRHLRLHVTHFTLSGFPVDRLEADIPFVTYDLGHAMYHDRLHIRSSGIGPAEVQVGRAGLETFILTKYPKLVKAIQVGFQDGKLTIQGKLNLLGGETPFSAVGFLAPREGRYLDFLEPELTLNGKPASPEFTAGVLKQLNPVLDTERDLHLNGFFTLTRVELTDDSIVIKGEASVPPASQRLGNPAPNGGSPPAPPP